MSIYCILTKLVIIIDIQLHCGFATFEYTCFVCLKEIAKNGVILDL